MSVGVRETYRLRVGRVSRFPQGSASPVALVAANLKTTVYFDPQLSVPIMTFSFIKHFYICSFMSCIRVGLLNVKFLLYSLLHILSNHHIIMLQMLPFDRIHDFSFRPSV